MSAGLKNVRTSGQISLDERLFSERTVAILLVRGENPDGEQIYAYVAVRSDRIDEFMRAQSGEDVFYPEDYGVIIEDGEGEPADEVRRRMADQYGFDHDSAISLPSVESAQKLWRRFDFPPPEDSPLEAEAARASQPHEGGAYAQSSENAADDADGYGPPDDRSAERFPDEISVMLYIDTDSVPAIARVVSAVDKFVEALGYGDPISPEVSRGSFIRRSWAKLRSGLTSDEVRDLGINVERAVELQYLDVRQADVDNKIAEALSQLILSIADVPSACVRAGSILLIKYPGPHGPTVLVKQLSQRELKALEKYPGIQQEPDKVLETLALAQEEAL
jgi:hypothetical protein